VSPIEAAGPIDQKGQGSGHPLANGKARCSKRAAIIKDQPWRNMPTKGQRADVPAPCRRVGRAGTTPRRPPPTNCMSAPRSCPGCTAPPLTHPLPAHGFNAPGVAGAGTQIRAPPWRYRVTTSTDRALPDNGRTGAVQRDRQTLNREHRKITIRLSGPRPDNMRVPAHRRAFQPTRTRKNNNKASNRHPVRIRRHLGERPQPSRRHGHSRHQRQSSQPGNIRRRAGLDRHDRRKRRADSSLSGKSTAAIY
jgi:hypothetical protein